MRLALAIALAVAVQITPAQANCEREHAIWSDTADPNRTIVYYAKYGWNSDLRFERWEGKRLIWEIDAPLLCSNGVVMCGLSLPLSDGTTLEAEFEEITAGERPE